MINIIASTGRNLEIGKDGDLIWRIKDDLLFFRRMTIDHDIIMGRKTFESLPKLLDRRHHIVLTRGNFVNSDVEVTSDVLSLLDRDAFVIGGASIYKLFIDYCDNIYLTEIDDECLDADTFFPSFDKSDFDREVLKECNDNNVLYKHVLYKRKIRRR